MSRIFVKGLPKHVNENRLREVFSQKGEVTDAKLIRTGDGKTRQIAFVGFRTEQEAREAISYFNNSYIDTCKIECEVARRVGDPGIQAPWSRHSLKKQEEVKKNAKKECVKAASDFAAKGDEKSNKNSKNNDDIQLQEFLQVMQPRVKSKMWENDILVAPSTDPSRKVTEKVKKAKGKSSKEVFSGDTESNRTNIAADVSDTENSENRAHDEMISDMDYFKSRVKKNWSDSDSESDSDGDDDSDVEKDADVADAMQQEVDEDTTEHVDDGNLEGGNALTNEKDGLVTGRLFVRNLCYSATEDEINELFSQYGDVSEVHLVVDRETKRSTGMAYILYPVIESAERALEELDNSIFQGRLLHVMPAKVKPSLDKKVTDDASTRGPKTFKQKREDERKAAEAGGDTRAWNSLFMRPDTVVENIARKYGVSKSDFLDSEADDLAVRIALGEAQVIGETKKALSNAGVNVASLEEFAAGKTDGTKRSKHVILVKNLPYGSSESDLAKMFGKFGSLDKIVLPPTKTIALVIFLEAAEARAAFKGLSYRRYKDAVLYLEWAPENILDHNPNSENNKKKDAAVGDGDAKKLYMEQHIEGISDMDIDPDRTESRSLFVKNLNFKTTDESLKEHFNGHIKQGKILSVRVKKHLKNGKNLSMGFGFIEFDSVETATRVCGDLQGTILDDHALNLQLCHAKKSEQVGKKAGKDTSSTKILVKNVAFEATAKDLKQLFSSFGQIKSLRVPTKLGNHRGFAFVEFVTKQEAQNALEALSNTHLYGRHLILERAKEGESLEDLRARTAAHFTDEQTGFENPTRISKKRKAMPALDFAD